MPDIIQQHPSTENGQAIAHVNNFGEKENALFNELKEQLAEQFRTTFPDKLAPRTVVVIPSLTLDHTILSKVKGHVFYEERLLCLLMLLRMPRTRIIYVTSVPIDPAIIDYYLHLLPGITGYHARQRLILLSCFDASSTPLTEKILQRPRMIERIKELIQPHSPAHITCFNVTEFEKSLALQLQIPLYGCDPELNYLGTKSAGRKLFRSLNILTPEGFEDVKNKEEVIDCLTALKQQKPSLKKAVVKMNDGFSGEGNAVFSYDGAPADDSLRNWVAEHITDKLKIVAAKLTSDLFFKKFEQMEGIVEEFLDAEVVTSPSVQCLIDPMGNSSVLSTHDQMLGGDDNQIFLGATFPADNAYAKEIGALGYIIAAGLKEKGVLGRFAVDFMSTKDGEGFKHYAIEINLRKGGTTHPYLMLQFLTEGDYDAEQGEYFMPDGKKRYYFATDNLQRDCYKGLTPHDLIDIAMMNDLHYSNAQEEGVMFHLISALSQFGKVGLVSIGRTPERAVEFYKKVVEVLNKECE
ncbi:MAG TPA: peptide ligase PGM1-related protein [Lacibacter sp.]|nr:peptide ligase PGM1-related protein [Lacibacter sp.]